jgi:Mg/Co/Ni transporter MgtE
LRTIVTLSDIDEAINNLGYTNEKQIKTRIINALRQFYSDESSVRTVTKINPDDLISLIRDTDNRLEDSCIGDTTPVDRYPGWA